MWRTALKISRPRFWIYLLGPFVVATAYVFFQLEKFLDVSWILWFLFWTFPANLWIYGVNDWADRDTDALNPKKGNQEHRLQDRDSWLKWLLLGVLGIMAFLFLSVDMTGKLWFFAWFVLGSGYSLPPFRFKARPFLDAYSNVLYALPGFLALWQWGGVLPAWWVIVSTLAWNAAMHAFSALPDIQADSQAGLATVATVLGKRGGLIFCAVNWLVPGLLLGWFVHPIGILAGLYAVIPLSLIGKSDKDLTKTYWLMPWVNVVAGFILFWTVVWM